MKKVTLLSTILIFSLGSGLAQGADVVPPVIDLPGTQPKEVGNFDPPGRCDNCHGGYDQSTYPQAPAFGWKGSAMGNAGRDPIFWATLAIAEQDFDGAGDLCIRCHSAAGWIAGRSTPTDGSGLQAGDEDGVDCDTCHKATNPDDSEHLGVMNEPFVANTPGTGEEGFYGSGILSSWGGNEKLGPYDAADAQAKHQRMKSKFHRSEDFCGTCHDVSNSAVGHFAPKHGTQPGQEGNVITADNNPYGPNLRYNPRPDHITGTNEAYVGLNNPPYAYGIVERTFSEYKSSAFSRLNPDNNGSTMPISNFSSLPTELQKVDGALELATRAGDNYDDPLAGPRHFTCQSCHMRAITGVGANKAGTPTRGDLPMHDFTGGNNWVFPLIKYQDQAGTLRLGGGLDSTQIAAMDAGVIRAEDSLRSAINMEVNGDTLKLTNLTGHKAITGYPEGRRMWLNIKWYDADNNLLREDGKYGPLPGVSVTYTASDGTVKHFQPESLLDLHDPNTKIYEAHYAMTQEWAYLLVNTVGYPGDLVLSYDRETGLPDYFLGDLANSAQGTYHETFHFAINNHVAKDNRIPPYGMRYDEAKKRNALPVPEYQYGGDENTQTPPTTYNHWDEYDLGATAASFSPNPATRAEITLNYQGTSWEYIQFLWKNNNEQNAFLGQEGVNMLDAWVNAQDANGRTMVPPLVMATATWGTPPLCESTEPGTELTCGDGLDNDCDGLADTDDPDCQPDVVCSDYPDKGSCNNDPTCEWSGSPKNGLCQDIAVCIPDELNTELTCTDGNDNDCDGAIDCADTDCSGDPACQVIDCSTYDGNRTLCTQDPTCSWVGKTKTCVNL